MLQKRENTGIMELDIHGMTKYQAKVTIDSKLKRAKQDIYRIRIIHGFHNGTELKDMIRREYQNHQKVLRIDGSISEGSTDLVLRELYH